MIVQFETNDGIVEADLHGSALKRAISKVQNGVGGITFQTQRDIDRPLSPIASLLERNKRFTKHK